MAEHASDWQIKTGAGRRDRQPRAAARLDDRTGEVGEAGGIDDALEDLRDKAGPAPGETPKRSCKPDLPGGELGRRRLP
jgi:hypothetical protein